MCIKFNFGHQQHERQSMPRLSYQELLPQHGLAWDYWATISPPSGLRWEMDLLLAWNRLIELNNVMEMNMILP
jgi:hypothetical protein